MVQSVTFSDGNTFNDGNTPPGNLGNDGHRSNLIRMFQSTVSEVALAVAAQSTSTSNASSASGSAAAAAASAAGVVLSTLSTSSVAIGTGTKTFTLAVAINIQVGQWFKCTDQASNANYVYGVVTSWNSGTRVIQIDVTNVGGSGTKSAWYCSVAGSPGAQGASGAGSGDLVAANNLSELTASASTARANIGAQKSESDYSRTGVSETRSASINMADNEFSSPKIKDASETVVNKSNQSGGVSIDFSAGHWQYMTLTNNITAITITNPPVSGTAGTLFLEFIQDGTGSRTIALNGSVYKFPERTAAALSTAASAVDIWAFTTRDGGATWRVFPNRDFG